MSEAEAVHRSYNPLTGRWVLVSPQRTKRPWIGKLEPDAAAISVSYDPECYLCPGNARANGQINPDYLGPYAFGNDFPALLPSDASQQGGANEDHGLFRCEAVSGECRVVCFSPDHGKTLPLLTSGEMRALIDCWADQARDLGQYYTWVQLFENKGAAMGCSNPHPHGQIWASNHIPDEPEVEDRMQRDYFAKNGVSMLLDLATREAQGPRVVLESDFWIAIVPWWAVWPFETLLLPRFNVQRMEQLDPEQRDDLAKALRGLTARYDNLFSCSFPYSMGWHGAPYVDEPCAHWQLHAHFYPPLLRSATIRKFMVGYEMLAEAQRDLTPEQAAARLREVSSFHFSANGAL